MREAIEHLETAVLSRPGAADSGLRRAAFDRATELAASDPAPSSFDRPLSTLVETVAVHAYRLTDEDVRASVEALGSEDAVFELVVATAVGAGMARLDRGLAALGEAAARRGDIRR